MVLTDRRTPLDDADPLCRLGAVALRDAYAARRLSPVEVAEATLRRAEAVQARFNAFTRIDRAAALGQARASEERWGRGAPLSPVDGVPATIKDIVWVEGWPIRFGSPSSGTVPCAADAPAVARMRAAGLVFLGLTTTPEFGWKAVTDGPLSGITRNPWHPDLTPGGSSGGASVAALTGAGVLHLGTDGGGSIRIPAAFTGIAGLKPTYGRVPAYPSSPFGTVAHLGPMGRRVGDLRAMLEVMSGPDARDWLQGPATWPSLAARERGFDGLRIGYWSRPPCGFVASEIAEVVEARLDDLAALGAAITSVELPEGDHLATFNTLWLSGAAARAALLSSEARDRLDPGLREAVAAGERIDAVSYVRAMGARADFGRAMESLAADFDVLVSPAAAIFPFAAGQEVPPGSGMTRWTSWAGFSFPINMTQQPAAVIPCGHSSAGLPIALQIIAPRGEDARVLDVAQAFEDAFPTLFVGQH